MRKSSTNTLGIFVFTAAGLFALVLSYVASQPQATAASPSLDSAIVSPSATPDLGSGASLHGKRVFPANNPWNQDISKFPVDPNSANLIASMGTTTGIHPDFGTVFGGAPNGIPYVVVPGAQVPVTCTFGIYADESDPGPYPVPADAPIEGGSGSSGDRHVLVLDRDHWKLFEMGNSFPQNGGASWTASGGAVYDLNSNVLRPAGWTSADAAGLPLFAGLVRYDEVVEQHAVNHALRFTVNISRRAYLYPARHYASSNTSANVPAMGTRVRLKSSVNINSFSANMQVILLAWKKYGMILADNGSDWFVSGAPDPRWSDSDLATLSRIKGSDFEVVVAPVHLTMPASDFDGDSHTDISVFRPSAGTWYVLKSTDGSFSAQLFGAATDKVAPGDYDGDGISDATVFRNGTWYISQSTDGALRAIQFGALGDVPVPADYDGDGKTDIAVFRSGAWYILRSTNGQFVTRFFGLATDIPAMNDFDGDGSADVAVWRPATGIWYELLSSNNQVRALQFGSMGDLPVAGDYDGDGKSDPAVYRSGTWYILQSSNSSFRAANFGLAGDRPTPGDYDFDGKFDLAVFRPGGGFWYVLNSFDGSFNARQFGVAGDIPVPAAYVP